MAVDATSVLTWKNSPGSSRKAAGMSSLLQGRKRGHLESPIKLKDEILSLFGPPVQSYRSETEPLIGYVDEAQVAK